jgi:hypothetical protein
LRRIGPSVRPSTARSIARATSGDSGSDLVFRLSFELTLV